MSRVGPLPRLVVLSALCVGLVATAGVLIADDRPRVETTFGHCTVHCHGSGDAAGQDSTTGVRANNAAPAESVVLGTATERQQEQSGGYSPPLVLGLAIAGLGGMLFVYGEKFARISEQLDAIGSTRELSDVKPALWKVVMMKIAGIVAVAFGTLYFLVSVLGHL